MIPLLQLPWTSMSNPCFFRAKTNEGHRLGIRVGDMIGWLDPTGIVWLDFGQWLTDREAAEVEIATVISLQVTGNETYAELQEVKAKYEAEVDAKMVPEVVDHMVGLLRSRLDELAQLFETRKSISELTLNFAQRISGLLDLDDASDLVTSFIEAQAIEDLLEQMNAGDLTGIRNIVGYAVATDNSAK